VFTFDLGILLAEEKTNNPLHIMAAKKIAKKTAKPAKPVAEKVAKKVIKKATKKVAEKPAKQPTVKKVAKSDVMRPSNDAIARAAYLNYRQRVEKGLPGDSRGDWLEAERQLGGGGQD
jgi:hypothetical protein